MFDGIYLIFCSSFHFKLIVFYFFDCCAQVEKKTAFVLLYVGKILYLLLSYKIVKTGTVFFVDQGLSSEQNTVARDYVKFIEDDDVSWDEFVRANSFEPCVLIVDEYVFLVFHFTCLPSSSYFDCHF